LEGTYVSKHEGELVSVRIISNERGKPSGKLADAEVASQTCRLAQRPQAGGFAVWERHEGGEA
jgi:hypothetical protein